MLRPAPPRHSGTAGDLAEGRRLLPHHVELVQAQSVYARPLTIHGLPEGLKEQVLWGGKQATRESWRNTEATLQSKGTEYEETWSGRCVQPTSAILSLSLLS